MDGVTWFPTPYPHESFYSLLCRYQHYQSALPAPYSIKQLYGDTAWWKHGLSIPALQKDQFDSTELVCEHTLFPYFTRCMSYHQKQRVLYKLVEEQDWPMVQTNILMGGSVRLGLKYCPICYQQDRQQYGEAYWHIEHQAPYMTMCPRHAVLLTMADIAKSTHPLHFIPLDTLDCVQNTHTQKQYDKKVSLMIYDFWRLPTDSGMTPGYNNLIPALVQHGYGKLIPTERQVQLDASGLYSALSLYYGNAIARRYFGQHGLDFNSLWRWKEPRPERYMFLAAFVGLNAQKLFGPRTMMEIPIMRRWTTSRAASGV